MLFFLLSRDLGCLAFEYCRDAAIFERRLSFYAEASPEELEIIAVTPGGFKARGVIQERFKASSLHGNWYRATPTFLDYIESIKGAGPKVPEWKQTRVRIGPQRKRGRPRSSPNTSMCNATTTGQQPSQVEVNSSKAAEDA